MTARYYATVELIDWSTCNTYRKSFPHVEVVYSDAEEKAIDRIALLMRIKGWNMDMSIGGVATCEVEDRAEAKDFMEDWKESKKCIMDCIKFGF